MDDQKSVETDAFESKEDRRSSLKTQWGDFARAFANPLTIYLFICVFFLTLIQGRAASNTGLSAAFILLIGLLTGVGISRFEKVYSEYKDRRPMVRRGKIAIRRLSVLIEYIRLLESKIDIFQKQLEGKSRISTETIDIKLEELKNYCLSLQIAGFSSIEDWIDVVPDVSVTTLQAQVIAKFLYDREAALQNVIRLNDELARDKDQPAEEKAKLQAEISKKEQEIALLNDLLFNSRTKGLWTTLSSEPSESFDDTPGTMYVAKCLVCGESYYTSSKDRDPWGRCTRCISEGRMPK
jgi:hypothetical protein